MPDTKPNLCPNQSYVYQKDNWYIPYRCPYALDFGPSGDGGCIGTFEQCSAQRQLDPPREQGEKIKNDYRL